MNNSRCVYPLGRKNCPLKTETGKQRCSICQWEDKTGLPRPSMAARRKTGAR